MKSFQPAVNLFPLTSLWDRLYPGEQRVRDGLLRFLASARHRLPPGTGTPFDPSGLVYCCYGEAFFSESHPTALDALADQLERLHSLGVRTLWTLPLLRSPGRDGGFDTSGYEEVDARFGGNPAFLRLLERARQAGILVVFDVAVNHTSEDHPWFISARSSRSSAHRSWYHWSDDDRRYAGAPHIFTGLVDSNWSWSAEAGQYYFHRFYPFQPDLNYAEPAVTAAMCRALAGWRIAGVQGFRLDAAPMLWKKEGSSCEGLPETHLVLKLFRAALDLLGGNTVLLAEANQPAAALREYFGEGDECNAAFHFPLLPLLWQAMVEEKPGVLVQARFPQLPPGCTWFTFLRCHDELTLELLPPEPRTKVMQALCRQPSWSFRGGLGISGRLFELLGRDPDRTVLAFSVLFSLPGTPVLYYGDEAAAGNNESYYRQKIRSTGFDDSRFLHRGPLEPGHAERAAANPDSPAGRVLRGLRRIMEARALVHGLAEVPPALEANGPVLIAERRAAGRTLVALSNLSTRSVEARGRLLAPYECLWEVS